MSPKHRIKWPPGGAASSSLYSSGDNYVAMKYTQSKFALSRITLLISIAFPSKLAGLKQLGVAVSVCAGMNRLHTASVPAGVLHPPLIGCLNVPIYPQRGF